MGQLSLGVEPDVFPYQWVMQALSLKEPWLQLILDGRKPFEFRTWRPRADLPIRIVLCSSKAFSRGQQDICLHYGYSPITMKRHLGRARATAIVQRCHTVDERFCNQMGYDYHDIERTTYAWELKQVVPIKSEPHVMGKQSLFRVVVGIKHPDDSRAIYDLDPAAIRTVQRTMDD